MKFGSFHAIAGLMPRGDPGTSEPNSFDRASGGFEAYLAPAMRWESIRRDTYEAETTPSGRCGLLDDDYASCRFRRGSHRGQPSSHSVHLQYRPSAPASSG